MSENLEGGGGSSNRRSYNGTGFASISAKIWGGDDYSPWLPTALVGVESGELNKIGTKTFIGILLVSRHIFKKNIRRHFLIRIIDRKLSSPLFVWNIRCLFVYLFVFIPVIVFSLC